MRPDDLNPTGSVATLVMKVLAGGAAALACGISIIHQVARLYWN